jgi:iron complex transport system substrate-binding protein
LPRRIFVLTRRREEREGVGNLRNPEELARTVVDYGFKLHKDLGPGLLESVYEAILAAVLRDLGFHADRQKPIPIEYHGLALPDAFRADLIVENSLIVEIKSVEHLAPVHAKQLLTYLRLLKQPLGLLLNFGAPTFRDGVKRVVNGHTNFASSRLRVHQKT